MALNHASHNPAGDKTGPVTGNPPEPETEVKDALVGASQQDPIGQNRGENDEIQGQPKKEKSAKEIAKEKAKAEKAAKFAAKQAKTQSSVVAPSKASKKKEAKEVEVLPPFKDDTPPGQKKQLRSFDDPHFKAYSPQAVEAGWYSWWEECGFHKPEFTPEGNVKPAGKFVICIPPPNVTGALHCGHALANALQDTLIRWHRMRGFTTVWVPGCDHAGISTQSVVEKMLWKKQKKTRHDLGREKFTELVWDWKKEYHEKINKVERRMGGSMDWSREAFTMDENLSAAVLETFCRLHDEGYIYRSNRLVNWCTQLNTALSNLEVDNKELTGRTLLDVPGYERKVEFGVLTYFKYPIVGSEDTVEVATTRPETMLGDTGIAVHPQDERYKHLVGKYAQHPFIQDRRLKIVADEYVDPAFGTGAVKLTPGHDPNDYNIGKNHNLEFINILNDDGTLNANAGPKFKGQKRFDARYTVVQALTELGLFVKKEPNPMKVPLCSKSKDIIEPLMKPQWWMRMKELAEEALKVVQQGEIKIAPETARKSYERWLSSINDWCLSRQLWWGHRIPAYFVKIEGENGDNMDNSLWITAQTPEEAQKKAEKKFAGKKFTLERDPDCLDTWFSSGLWPMSTLGWPNTEHPDFSKLFPTSVLETGWDILFFWVARMIMFSLKLTGKVPFTEVYCHSLIRDSEGRKMSKSLGNVIDPVDIMEGIDLESLHAKLLVGNLDEKEVAQATKYQKTAFPQGIPECGADALRFTLISYTTGGGDIAFDIKVMHGYRRFCNKIYQASKYVLGRLPEGFVPNSSAYSSTKLSLAEKWILSRMNTAIKNINLALTAREFSRSTQIAYQYFYDELCDVFIENSKAILNEGAPDEQQAALQTLYTCLDTALRMLHPFMPFLTEELWQRLPRRQGDSTPSIVIASYPEHDPRMDDLVAAEQYELILGCSKGVRSLMSEYGIKDEGRAFVQTFSETSYNTAKTEASAIKSLVGKGVSSIDIFGPSDPTPKGCAVYVVSSSAAVFLEVKGRVVVDTEIKKATSKLEKARQGVQKQKQILEKPDFAEKVSEAVRDLELQKLKDAEAEIQNYEKSIEQFQLLKLEEAQN